MNRQTLVNRQTDTCKQTDACKLQALVNRQVDTSTGTFVQLKTDYIDTSRQTDRQRDTCKKTDRHSDPITHVCLILSIIFLAKLATKSN